MGAFPPIIARVLIGAFSRHGEVVLDPFSGRGTTLLEARLMDRIPVVSDLSPLAVAITGAKNVSPGLHSLQKRVRTLRSEFDRPLYLSEARAQPAPIQLIYHPRTLAQLCYLRRRLKPTSSIDTLLLGATLGVMHGNARRNGESAYASISMPNTFSMSADYVRRFVQQRQIDRPFRDVFDLLDRKLERLYAYGAPDSDTGTVLLADAKRLRDEPRMATYQGRIRLVLTSPPYLNVVNYAKQNWIRMWLLGADAMKVQKGLDDNLQIGPWLRFMTQSLREMHGLLGPRGTIALIIGDVARSRTSVLSPARELIRLVRHEGMFGWVGCISDRMDVSEKVSRIWKTTKGNATTVDRVVLFASEQPSIEMCAGIEGQRFERLDAQTLEQEADLFAS